ncbi:hypothetical protein DEU56DRAFT_751152 [Suillus clintonianus]|uniref:uncharacterized protein n=1 Tax=Suillus clintonianus TaxID=1904413 RepID=UPI001B874170|nr:uncharacterized protein DEU56DRAFT_751152 [Suillus clintonianus]KAG2155649.1 hypothetical protein DEU56DRAFT_751152 [Suillus clintonianus]
MGFFSVMRITLFSLSIAFSLIGLGLNAYFISLTVPYFYFIFSALGVATAALTLLTVPVMLIIDFVRRGAFTSMIVFELSWLFVLAILWVATAGEAIYTYNFYYPEGCVYDDPTINAYCMELQTVEAFAFLNFFIFLGYTCTLLVCSIIATTRGNSVWTYSVKESTFFAQKSWPAQQQAPPAQFTGAPAQFTGAPATGYTGTPVSQPQQLGTYSTHSGTPAHSPQTQPQQFQPVYSGHQQGIPV